MCLLISLPADDFDGDLTLLQIAVHKFILCVIVKVECQLFMKF